MVSGALMRRNSIHGVLGVEWVDSAVFSHSRISIPRYKKCINQSATTSYSKPLALYPAYLAQVVINLEKYVSSMARLLRHALQHSQTPI
jgi:hypothetical protein